MVDSGGVPGWRSRELVFFLFFLLSVLSCSWDRISFSQAGLKLPKLLRLALNFWYFCLHFLSTGTIGICQQKWVVQCWGLNLGWGRHITYHLTAIPLAWIRETFGSGERISVGTKSLEPLDLTRLWRSPWIIYGFPKYFCCLPGSLGEMSWAGQIWSQTG